MRKAANRKGKRPRRIDHGVGLNPYFSDNCHDGLKSVLAYTGLPEARAAAWNRDPRRAWFRIQTSGLGRPFLYSEAIQEFNAKCLAGAFRRVKRGSPVPSEAQTIGRDGHPLVSKSKA